MGSPELAKIGRILLRPKAWVPNTPSQAPGAATTARARSSRERVL
jgi:hypothetical protein